MAKKAGRPEHKIAEFGRHAAKWLGRQSDPVKVAVVGGAVALVLIGGFVLYSFVSAHFVLLLCILGGLALLSAAVGGFVYFREKRRLAAEAPGAVETSEKFGVNRFQCPSCRDFNPEGSKACVHCGRPFGDPDALTSWESKRGEEIQLTGGASRTPDELLGEPAPRAGKAKRPARERDWDPPPSPTWRPVSGGAARSFGAEAVIVCLLYLFCCWPVAAIANVVLLMQADREFKVTGDSPPGRGVLRLMMWMFILIPVILLGAVLAILILTPIATEQGIQAP